MHRFVQPLCGFAVLAFMQSAYAQPAPVERPALKPGTEWVYKVDNSKRDKPGPAAELKRVVKEVGAKEVAIDVTLPSGTRTTAMSRELNPYSEGMTSGAARASDAMPYFSFPLAPGKTYAGKLAYPAPIGGGSINIDMATKVLDWEDVTVPAGKFRALKIEANGKASGVVTGTRKITLWYVPEVANYVRMEFYMSYGPFAGTSVQELASFSLK